MATHVSVLAWRTLWTEGPGGLQSRSWPQESDMTQRLNHPPPPKQPPAWLPLLSRPGWTLRPSPHPLVHSDLLKHTISPSWLISKHFLPSTGEADALSLILLRPQDLWAVQGLFISSTRRHRHPCSVVLMSCLSTFLEPQDLSSLSSMIFLKSTGSHACMHAKLLWLCPILCDPMELQPARLLCPWDSPGKNTGVGCHFLLREIFSTQESNPGLLHCRQILYQQL